MFNPSVIVIGGAMGSAGEVFLAEVRQRVYELSLPLATRDLTITLSVADEREPLRGGAELAREQLFDVTFPRWFADGRPSPDAGRSSRLRSAPTRPLRRRRGKHWVPAFRPASSQASRWNGRTSGEPGRACRYGTISWKSTATACVPRGSPRRPARTSLSCTNHQPRSSCRAPGDTRPRPEHHAQLPWRQRNAVHLHRETGDAGERH